MVDKEKRPSSPQLELLDYRLRHCYIRENPDYDPESPVGGALTLTSRVSIADEDDHMFRIMLGCAFPVEEGTNYPFEMEIGVEGDFSSAFPAKEGRVPAFLASNAFLILWGIARGITGPITATFGTGLFVWPTVSFDDYAADAAEREEAGISEFFSAADYIEHLARTNPGARKKKTGTRR